MYKMYIYKIYENVQKTSPNIKMKKKNGKK